MLDMGRPELATLAKVGQRTIVDFERGARIPLRQTLLVIKSALEERGIEFLDNNAIRYSAPLTHAAIQGG